ncbi:MAG: hypothetical protein HZC44_09465 [Geobacter sp.]|nr:hypothetical protein [Geobacter sp.]
MQIYHLTEIDEIAPAAVTPVLYGRYAAPILDDGSVVCDNHRFTIDAPTQPLPGEKVMIWCEHDYFCCSFSEYESDHRH